MAQLNFNASQVEPAGSFAVYDSGVYTVMVSGSELKETKAKKEGRAAVGSYWQFNMRIAEGPHAGGTLLDRVNWENENPDAVSIGQAQLSAMCRVMGVMQLQDSQQLHGIPFKVEVARVPRNDDPSKESNEIRAYLDTNGVEASQMGQGNAAPAANAAPAQSAPQPPQSSAPTPPADPTPPALTRPTDPAHIHEAGTPNEQWWDGTAWVKAPVEEAPAPAAPTPPPAATNPPEDSAPTPPAAGATPPWVKKD